MKPPKAELPVRVKEKMIQSQQLTKSFVKRFRKMAGKMTVVFKKGVSYPSIIEKKEIKLEHIENLLEWLENDAIPNLLSLQRQALLKQVEGIIDNTPQLQLHSELRKKLSALKGE